MAKTSTPSLVKLFESLLWANSPKDWIIHSTYYHQTLFVSILKGQSQKIRRSFRLDIINKRQEDLWGMAVDCIDEIKTEVKTNRD